MCGAETTSFRYVGAQEGRVQAVFADCYKDTPVVTVIDTETNHPCGPC